MKRRRVLVLVVLGVVLALSAVIAAAQGGSSSPGIVLTDHYVLNEGQRVEGDLVVLAQTISLAPGSVVAGDVALLGESITVRGRIDGDLAVLGSDVVFGSGLDVRGDASVCGDTIRRLDNATIAGSYDPNCEDVRDVLGSVAALPFSSGTLSDMATDFDTLDGVNWDELEVRGPEVSPLGRLGLNLGWSLTMGGMAALFVLFFPRRLRRVSEAALDAPLTTGVVGMLSLLASGAVSGLVLISLVLVVTFCLLPLVGLGWVALALLIVFGWVALSLPVGVWVLSLFNVQRVSAIAAAAVGAAVLTFGLGLLTLNGWTLLLYLLVGMALTAWGLGAIVMTRFGSQRYPNPVRVQSTPPPPPEDDFSFET